MVWFNIIQAVLTLAIGVIVAYIAWQQWQLNRTKHRLDLYDRRLKIYQEVKVLINTVVRCGDVSSQELISFISNSSEADFLFGDEIKEYIDALYKKGADLSALTKGRKHAADHGEPPHYNYEENSKKISEIYLWYGKQFEISYEKFLPYLSLVEKNAARPKAK